MVIIAQHTEDIAVKPGYKQTEVGVIPEDWEVRTLGDCLLSSPQYGINAPAIQYTDSLPTYLRITDITDDGNFSPENIVSVRHADVDRYVLDIGDLVFARTGASVGKTYLYNSKDGRLVFAGYLIRVKANPSKLLPDYLAAYVKTEYYWNWVKIMSTRSGQPGINGQEYAQLPITLPPLPEQRAIAAALSDVDALITSLDQLIAKKRDIKQATMQQLLTGRTRLPGFSGQWKVQTFGEMFQFLNTANNSRSDLTESGDIQYVHYGDIHTKWRTFLDCSHDAIPFIHKDKVNNISFLEDGDVVMADASEDYEGIGISVEVKNATNRKVVAGLHTLLLRGDKSILADGFKGYLQYIPDVKDALKKAATGISVYGISKNNLKQISIYIPDIREQRAIATILSDMDAEIAALEQRREKTRALKQGMMQELLTGKTRLR